MFPLLLLSVLTGAVCALDGSSSARVQSEEATTHYVSPPAFTPALQVTSVFPRPGAHPALDLSDARLAPPAMRSGFRKTSWAEVKANANARGERDEDRAHPDHPTQVHVLPGGPGVMTVVWVTTAALDPGDDVRFGRAEHEQGGDGDGDGDGTEVELKMRASVASTAYTAQICLGEPNNVEAVMGPMHPVRVDDLVYLANTSRWAPPDANNYRVIKGPDDVVPPGWFGTPPWEKALCLAYNNPDSQYQSPLVHTAQLASLTPGATYRYKLPGDIDGTRRTFRALPGAETEAAADGMTPGKKRSSGGRAVFGVVGDTGQTEVTHEVFKHLQSMDDLDVLLHTGDLSYADGFPPRWDSFGRLAEPLMSRLPTLTVPGNHDVTLNGLESMAYRTRYPSPYAASSSASPDWWSLDVGPAHVIGLSSYAPVVGPGMFDGAVAPMKAWLLKDLTQVDRHRTPWLIVMFHVPWYNSNAGHYKEAWRAQEALEQTLFDAGVDIVLNGHVHAYERSHPVNAGKVDSCGAVHLVVGDGGNYEGPYGKGWKSPQPSWSAFREGSFGAGRLEILNATHATWQWRRTACVEPAGETGLNETWYKPTGDHGGNNCSSIPDVSAQAMEAVDEAMIVRDVIACPNRRPNHGPRVPPPPPKEEKDEEETKEHSREALLAGFIVFLSLGWAATLAGLLWVCVLLRRERRTGRWSPWANSRPHFRLDDDFDETEIEL